jgi:hypothetical protein
VYLAEVPQWFDLNTEQQDKYKQTHNATTAAAAQQQHHNDKTSLMSAKEVVEVHVQSESEDARQWYHSMQRNCVHIGAVCAA